MKKLILGLTVIGTLGLASSAFAEVTAMTLRFAGGCKTENTGSCNIRVNAEGTSLDSANWQLQHADSQKGPFRSISKRLRSFDTDGAGSIRFRNAAGCYRAVTGPNGNDVPDIHSNVKCEK